MRKFHILIALPSTSNRNWARCCGVKPAGTSRGDVREPAEPFDRAISGSCRLTKAWRSSADTPLSGRIAEWNDCCWPWSRPRRSSTGEQHRRFDAEDRSLVSLSRCEGFKWNIVVTYDGLSACFQVLIRIQRGLTNLLTAQGLYSLLITLHTLLDTILTKRVTKRAWDEMQREGKVMRCVPWAGKVVRYHPGAGKLSRYPSPRASRAGPSTHEPS